LDLIRRWGWSSHVEPFEQRGLSPHRSECQEPQGDLIASRQPPVMGASIRTSGCGFRVVSSTSGIRTRVGETWTRHPVREATCQRSSCILVVEILSTEDNYAETRARASDYFRMGVTAVWIVDPRDRSSHWSNPNHPARRLCSRECSFFPTLRSTSTPSTYSRSGRKLVVRLITQRDKW
jgi:Putative restriction endonuclease